VSVALEAEFGGTAEARDARERILVLLPEDPSSDPRVSWVIDLCAEYARTEVVSLAYCFSKPTVRYDNRVSIESNSLGLFLKPHGYLGSLLNNRVRFMALTTEFAERPLHETNSAMPSERWFARLKRRARYHIGGVLHTLVYLSDTSRLIDAVRTRVSSLTIPPRLVVCVDLWTLQAAVELKRRFGCKVIYDCHEFTPHMKLNAHGAEIAHWRRYERKWARHIDAFVTVTPQIAELCARLYGLRKAHCVPNAPPLCPPRRPSCQRPLRAKVLFLLQGGAAPGRGFEALLHAWRRFNEPRACLLIRCPDSAYLNSLRAANADLVREGGVRFLPAVGADDLVAAAAVADIGVIPYPKKVGDFEPNYNHLYCCPNKLGQYMQAGLAILSTDSHFVSSCLTKYQCGLTYDPENADSLIAAARAFVENPAKLQRMKDNAFAWGCREYHWQEQSQVFHRLIADLTGFTRTPRLCAQAA
jgi:glycosyltransferase involved in cell wall biosynthesis